MKTTNLLDIQFPEIVDVLETLEAIGIIQQYHESCCNVCPYKLMADIKEEHE